MEVYYIFAVFKVRGFTLFFWKKSLKQRTSFVVFTGRSFKNKRGKRMTIQESLYYPKIKYTSSVRKESIRSGNVPASNSLKKL